MHRARELEEELLDLRGEGVNGDDKFEIISGSMCSTWRAGRPLLWYETSGRFLMMCAFGRRPGRI